MWPAGLLGAVRQRPGPGHRGPPASRRSPEEARLLLELGDGRPESITGPMVTMGAVASDPVALASFEAVGAWLGQGMADLAVILDPRGIHRRRWGVGGRRAAGWPGPTTFEAQLTGRGYRPSAMVRVAELGQDAALIGAADLARR